MPFTVGPSDHFSFQNFQQHNRCSIHFPIEMSQLLLCSVKQCCCWRMSREGQWGEGENGGERKMRQVVSDTDWGLLSVPGDYWTSNRQWRTAVLGSPPVSLMFVDSVKIKTQLKVHWPSDPLAFVSVWTTDLLLVIYLHFNWFSNCFEFFCHWLESGCTEAWGEISSLAVTRTLSVVLLSCSLYKHDHPIMKSPGRL